MVLATQMETQQCNEINKTFPVINIVSLMETMPRPHTLCSTDGEQARGMLMLLLKHA